MGKLFGTDGIRGIVNNDLTAELALKIGASVAKNVKKSKGKDKLTFLVGSDTRISKDMLTLALSSGVLSEGCNIINVGVLPTPAISYLIRKYSLDGGFVISASHNPSEYNGIKVLDEDGYKLSDEIENECEKSILNFKLNDKVNNCGTFTNKLDATNDYVDYLVSIINEDISSLKIVIDTANGASYLTADKLFSKLNANYTLINNEPDGLNINENAGSTHIEVLKETVVNGGYDVGIAYDGDADRVILVDENGKDLDGDYILAIAGSELKKNNRLTNNTIVGTIMTNLGLVKFCEANDINFVATTVGDKYVLEEMLNNNYILGGEQSGHIIVKDLANTGDGELTSIQILNIMVKNNKKLSELASIMKKYPQALINAKVSKEGKETFKKNEDIQNKINILEQELNGDGRIVVRASGTENLIRVMIEGSDIDKISEICKELADYIESVLN